MQSRLPLCAHLRYVLGDGLYPDHVCHESLSAGQLFHDDAAHCAGHFNSPDRDAHQRGGIGLQEKIPGVCPNAARAIHFREADSGRCHGRDCSFLYLYSRAVRHYFFDHRGVILPGAHCGYCAQMVPGKNQLAMCPWHCGDSGVFQSYLPAKSFCREWQLIGPLAFRSGSRYWLGRGGRYCGQGL